MDVEEFLAGLSDEERQDLCDFLVCADRTPTAHRLRALEAKAARAGLPLINEHGLATQLAVQVTTAARELVRAARAHAPKAKKVYCHACEVGLGTGRVCSICGRRRK